MNKCIYFELNNWFCGRDYPPCEPIKSWVENNQFNNNEWCKENKLCVRNGLVDMSENWCITAPVEWVEENFPELLNGGEFTYQLCVYSGGRNYTENYTNTYDSFRRYPNEYECVSGRFDWPFLDYSEENYGSFYYEYDYWDDLDDDENDEDET